MSNQIIYFLESIKDESVIRFILNNLSKNDLEYLFDLLEQCNPQTEAEWQKVYYKMYK